MVSRSSSQQRLSTPPSEDVQEPMHKQDTYATLRSSITDNLPVVVDKAAIPAEAQSVTEPTVLPFDGTYSRRSRKNQTSKSSFRSAFPAHSRP